jgi:hypothetical protein
MPSPTPAPPASQVQTFCPRFAYRRLLPVALDAAAVAALAEGHVRVELWHQAPRSQAVAAALSSGRPAAAAAAGPCGGGGGRAGLAPQQSVYLGGAALPLAPLLLRPQVRALDCDQI